MEERIRDQIWLKLVGNAAFNVVTALTGATMGQLGEPPEICALGGGHVADAEARREQQLASFEPGGRIRQL